MNARQPIPDVLFREVHQLADGVLDGTLSDEQCVQLDQLVCTDAVARQLYVRYIFDSDGLRNWAGAVLSEIFAEDQTLVLDDLDKDAICREISKQGRFPTNSLGAHVLGNAIHGALGYFSEGMPLAYLLATVIVGVGLLIGALVHVSKPIQVATQVPPITKGRALPEPQMNFVGRITGMVDCQWADESTAAFNDASVPLGRKYALAAGLMEITYDTGAKVILQGPCTYEVESPAGGFLAVGKLTARVEKKETSLPSPASGRGAGGEGGAPSSSSFLIPRSYFAVRTPTATVTDLGTEFGVEVDDQNVCHVETFTGLVNVSPVAGGESKDSRPLAAGESMRIDAAGVMAKTSTKSTHFVRNIVRQGPNVYAKLVLEDRPLVYWPLNESPNAQWIGDRSGHGCSGHLIRGVRLGQKGPFNNGRSRVAEFTGNDYIQADPLPKSDPAKGFSVEAWARADGGNGQEMYRSLITCRDDSGVANRTGFTLYAADDDHWVFSTGMGTFWAGLSGPPVVLGQWVYIVGTFEPVNKDSDGVFLGVKKLYLNGDLVATENQQWKPNSVVPARIGAGRTESPVGDYFFIGRIAEVAVYDRPLDANRIKTHWEVGKPAVAAVGPSQERSVIK